METQRYRRGISIGSLCRRKLSGFRGGAEEEEERERAQRVHAATVGGGERDLDSLPQFVQRLLSLYVWQR